MPTASITAAPDAADDLGRTLVEEGHAACVNRVPCQSIYHWDGEIHDDEEVILLPETTAEGYADLRDRVVDPHPYDVPGVERFDEDAQLDAIAD